uniref:Uncharacterized protein n=1 Tax=Siphoviridae sp. ctjKY6 TaxID=2825631 RepID=A0A8S5UY36_9CAUD|nr:MAG TPA: hypothetical protein [Siphoviridae sp. ctjKY6]
MFSNGAVKHQTLRSADSAEGYPLLHEAHPHKYL